MSQGREHQFLRWIKDDLDELILDAREALEAYVEQDAIAIELCIERLHQIQSTLAMAQVYGPSMLAEEMEAVAIWLKAQASEPTEEAAEVLMLSLIRLPDHLEIIVEGVPDTPFFVLDLLNDLRAVRDAPLLTEASLFSSDSTQAPLPEQITGEANPTIPALVQRLRGHFHKGLLEWYRNTDVQGGIKRLQDIARLIKEQATTQPVYTLFRVVEAVAEGLLEDRIEKGSALKSVFGKLDPVLKKLLNNGESAVSETVVRELVNSLLFYLVQIESESPLIQSVRDDYGLSQAFVPTAQQIKESRKRLNRPNADLYASVSNELESEMGHIKDTLDLFIRSDRDTVDELVDLIAPVQKLADTLGVLGHGRLRSRLTQQAETLQKIAEGRLLADDEVLLDVASGLLYVEQHMLSLPQTLEAVNAWNTTSVENDNQALIVEALQQSLDEIHQVKLAVEDVIAGREGDELEGAIARLQQVAGALKLLDYMQAAELLEAAQAYLAQGLINKGTQEELDGLADIIVGVELYIEALAQGQDTNELYLHTATEGLGRLPVLNAEINVDVSGDPTRHAIEPQASIDDTPSEDEPSIDASLEDIDPEILEIFVEEAREELEIIEDYIPRWIKDSTETDALASFRRSFHTLKGSGRLVGAETMGDFAWSIENLLNRVIEKQVETSPALFHVMDEALNMLPILVDSLESGVRPPCDYLALIEKANAVANGEEIEFDAEAPQSLDVEAEIEPSDEGIDSEMAEDRDVSITSEPILQLESELHTVFDAEAQSHLRSIEQFLSNCRQGNGQHCFVDDALARALHTLKGSAQVADVPPIAELGLALESLAKALVDSELATDAEVHELLDESVIIVSDILSVINVPDVDVPDISELVRQAENKTAAILQSQPIPSHVAEPFIDEPAPLVTANDIIPQDDEADEDAELRVIFHEEACDLLEDLELAIVQWQADDMASQPLESIQRTLHTLKGGARLAGQSSIGDLSHGLESVCAAVADQRLSTTESTFGLVRRAADELALQVDQLQNGQPRHAATLLAELESALLPDEETLVAEQNLAEDVHDGQEVAEVELIVEEPPILSDEVESAEDRPLEESPSAEEQMDTTSSDQVTMPRQSDGNLSEVAGVQFTPIPALQPASQSASESTGSVNRATQDRHEQVRVSANLLDQLVNSAGEISIVRSRLDQHNAETGYNLDELGRTVERLRGQLRKLDMETEAQILHRFEREQIKFDEAHDGFDPLELDRFSTMQQLSRSLMETVNDLVSIKDTLGDLQRESDTILLQQSRLSSVVQDGLLRTRMVKFSQQVPRLQRLVRQTCSSLGKQAELAVQGGEKEMDRAILDRMVSPLEHILRNAISHGIESPADRKEAGKPEVGRVNIQVGRQGAEIVMVISDDGHGLNLSSIREQAIHKGLLDEEAKIKGRDLMQFVLETGFSTAEKVTQIAGRGVGLDVVASEVKQLGGLLEIDSELTKGTRFTIRLPLTLAITDALLVSQGDEVFAIPHTSIEGVVRVNREKLNACYKLRENGFSYAGREYPVRYLGQLLGVSEPDLAPGKKWFPMLLAKSGEQRLALHVDSFLGNRQIVVKSVGMQLNTVRWISGGTILGDGRVALILDMHALARMSAAQTRGSVQTQAPDVEPDVTVMVVDDSITVRKVTSRLLKRQNMGVILAKDGVDAVTQLQQEKLPDVMLLDIEMPRMDGYELARHMRSSQRLKHIPIIMITSRVGDKHRRQAMELGVKRYLGKPYQETELMDNIYAVLAEAYV